MSRQPLGDLLTALNRLEAHGAHERTVELILFRRLTNFHRVSRDYYSALEDR
jgi:hypothetical protein